MKFERIVADAGYESEENLTCLKEKGIAAYIKPGNYEQIGTRKFSKEIGRKENMMYDAEHDCYICCNGKAVKKREAEKSKQPQDISGKKPITTVKNATAPCMFAYKVVTN